MRSGFVYIYHEPPDTFPINLKRSPRSIPGVLLSKPSPYLLPTNPTTGMTTLLANHGAAHTLPRTLTGINALTTAHAIAKSITPLPSIHPSNPFFSIYFLNLVYPVSIHSTGRRSAGFQDVRLKTAKRVKSGITAVSSWRMRKEVRWDVGWVRRGRV